MKKLLLVLISVLFLFPVTYAQAASKPEKYWNPGHYLTFSDFIERSDSPAQIEDQKQAVIRRVTRTGQYSVLKGYKLKVGWRTFEPSKGTYSFERYDAVMEALPEGKQLFFLILDRDFQRTCAQQRNIPDYVMNFQVNGADYSAVPLDEGDANGCIARIWEPEISNRKVLLYSAIAEHYKDNPKFGGIITEESAVNIDFTKYGFQTASQFKARLYEETSRVASDVADKFHKAHLAVSFNFLGAGAGGNGFCGYLVPFSTIVRDNGQAISNPDTTYKGAVPDATDPCRPYPVYKIYRDVKGTLPVMPGNDTSMLGDPNNARGNLESFNGKPMNMSNLVEALYLMMVPGFTYQGQRVEGLGANYIFWNEGFFSKDGGTQQGYTEAVLNFINQPGHEVVKTCPQNITCVPLSRQPTPTITPTIAPTPTSLRGDIAPLNAPNGKVDIFDYNLLLQNFGQSGSLGFHPADIVVNGRVDIFDYNVLLVEFGS